MILASQSLLSYLDEVHDSKAVLDARFGILHHEVIPLCMLACVEVKAKPKFIIIITARGKQK